MLLRIDLKIIFMIILFFFTKQLEIYLLILIFIVIHELGHILMGYILGQRISKVELIPLGINVDFKININDYNKKIFKGNLLEVKKILMAMAGPLTTIVIIGVLIILNNSYNSDILDNLIYINITILLINLIIIYPLDGGRILKGIIHIFIGSRKSEKIINIISFISLIVLSFISSIYILIYSNIAIFIIIVFLWVLHINEDRLYRKRENIYSLIQKSIEKNNNK